MKDSTEILPLKADWYRSPLVQEDRYRNEEDCDNIHNNNNNSGFRNRVVGTVSGVREWGVRGKVVHFP